MYMVGDLVSVSCFGGGRMAALVASPPDRRRHLTYDTVIAEHGTHDVIPLIVEEREIKP